MPERTTERTRERESAVDPEIEALLDDTPPAATDTDDRNGRHRRADGSNRGRNGGLRAGLRERRGNLFSLRAFGGVLVLFVIASLIGGAVPVIGPVGGLVGLFVAAFAVGLVSSNRRYVETGLAGAVTAAITLLLGSLNLAVIAALRGLGPEIGVVGAGAGLLVALVGHYFGRDLRNGLTTDLDGF